MRFSYSQRARKSASAKQAGKRWFFTILFTQPELLKARLEATDADIEFSVA
jgi:hypothetical protein